MKQFGLDHGYLMVEHQHHECKDYPTEKRLYLIITTTFISYNPRFTLKELKLNFHKMNDTDM
jgi:hypothetical protein